MVIILRHCEGAQRLRQSPIAQAGIATPPLAATSDKRGVTASMSDAVSLSPEGDCFDLAISGRGLAMTRVVSFQPEWQNLPWRYSQ
jgi:hypothetical protein